MENLSGKKAIVAGASRGIGLAIAKALAAAGASTLLAARSEGALDDAVAGITQNGFQASRRQLDLTNAESIQQFAASVEIPDILIQVAGTNVRKPFTDYTHAEINALFETNLNGIVRLTQLMGKRMIERGAGGKVVLIGSLASFLGLPYLSVYTMTKSALAGLARALAAEWGQYGIQVNCIAPGFILTDLNRAMWQEAEMKKWLEGNQANPRLGSPEDIAPLAVFLSSSGSDYITGQLIAVDGGYGTTAVWPFKP